MQAWRPGSSCRVSWGSVAQRESECLSCMQERRGNPAVFHVHSEQEEEGRSEQQVQGWLLKAGNRKGARMEERSHGRWGRRGEGDLYSCNSRNHSTKCYIRAVFRPFVGLGNKYGTWAQWQLRIKGGSAPWIHFRCSSQTLGAVSLCSLSRHLLAKFGGKMRMYVFLFWPVQSNVVRDSPCGTLVHHHHRCTRY